jgi:flagellar biosynthesis protein FlhF
MRIKSYYSPRVEDAIALARQELGPEAMLVNNRRALPDARHLGEYEVVFVTDAPGTEDEAGSGSPLPPRSPDRLSADVSDLKRELETMRRALTHSAYAPQQWTGASPDAAHAYARLTSNDLNPELARGIVDGAEKRVEEGRKRHEPGGFPRALAQELGSRICVQPALGRGEAKPHIVALVGPPGCGKTTTLVKLAVNYGLASRRPVLLLSMDTYRVAAADQLRSYAAILGVGFQVLETVMALAQAIEENRGKELIFIDTPGFGFGDLDAAADLAPFLATRQDVDTQLVLPSSMKAPDLTRTVDAFEVFRPQRLLFTKADETNSFGPILNESARTGKPVSFLTTGQRIPEDLETATVPRLVELILASDRVDAADGGLGAIP